MKLRRTTYFEEEYLPRLEQNDRSTIERLATMKMLASADDPRPTIYGILVLGKHPRDYLPGAYVQFLRIAGTALDCPIVDEHLFDGPIGTLIGGFEDKLRSGSLVVAAMYTTIGRSSSIPPSCTSFAISGTNRCITGQLARYAAISASCAMRPRNSPRVSFRRLSSPASMASGDCRAGRSLYTALRRSVTACWRWLTRNWFDHGRSSRSTADSRAAPDRSAAPPIDRSVFDWAMTEAEPSAQRWTLTCGMLWWNGG